MELIRIPDVRVGTVGAFCCGVCLCLLMRESPLEVIRVTIRGNRIKEITISCGSPGSIKDWWLNYESVSLPSVDDDLRSIFIQHITGMPWQDLLGQNLTNHTSVYFTRTKIEVFS